MLDDLLTPGLKLVICGTAASRRSAALGQYYAGPGNKFWRILAEIGLTPRQLSPAEYRLLPNFGLGLTDIAKAQSGNDHEIAFTESGRHDLRTKIRAVQPSVLCFNGKRAAKEYFGTTGVTFGLQQESIGATRLFVAPSTSGAANRTWDPMLWRELAHHVQAKQSAT